MSSSSGITSPVQAAIQGSKGNVAQIVQIIKLPESLENSAKTLRLEGKITSQDVKNNTARIETERGTIDVKIKGNKQPQVGQKIEIEIPANTQRGQQPRQAIIRTEPAPQNVNQQNSNAPRQTPSQNTANITANNAATKVTTPPPSSQPTGNQAQAQSLTTPTQQNISRTTQPIPPVLQETLSTQNASNIPQPARAITPESLIRLLSVPPIQAQNIAKEFISALPQPTANIIDKTVFRAIITAQNIINQTTQTTPLLRIPSTRTSTTIQPQQSTIPLTPTTQNAAHPILNNTFISQAQPSLQTTLQQTTYLQPTVLNTSQPLTTNQVLPPSIATTIIAPQTNSPTAIPTAATSALPNASLTPVTFDPSNPTQINTQRVSQIDINIVKITPPNATLSAPITTNLAPPSPIPAATQFTPPIINANTATSLSAQVTGFTAQNLPLITIQGISGGLPQSFILQQTGTNLQLGSQLQIIPKNGVPVSGQLSPVTTQTISNPLLKGFQWPALDELYLSLRQINPQTAASLVRTLPNTGNSAQIAAAAMTFIAAVKSGNLESWLGDKKIDLLRQVGQRHILRGLTQDTTRTGTPEPAISSEWRAVPMPMFWDSEIHRIMLYTRHENDEQENKNKNGQTRFIFNLNLTRMGDVQIDGLIKDKRLDLIIRTQNAFSEPMQQTMRQAYTGALDQTDLSGELNFQGSAKNWVHVLEKEKKLGINI